jgi:uridine kinase
VVEREATVETYADLVGRILARPSVLPRLVAVDGPGGAGKSVFAARLAAALGSAPVVHTDDFTPGELGREWWNRLQREVIDPLVEGWPARYQRYDWDKGALAEWHEVDSASAVIIEGVSSARRRIADLLSLAVWVHAPRSTRLARGLDRDGQAARGFWERWMAEEDEHFGADRTIVRCDLLIDGAPKISHDPEREFVRLASCVYE